MFRREGHNDLTLGVNGHNRKNVILSFQWFRPEYIVILLAVSFIGGLIVAAHLSVRPKKGKDAD